MAFKKQFKVKLDELWSRRIAPILKLMKIPGSRKSLSKPFREKRIQELLEIATRILRSKARREIRRFVKRRSQRRIRGYGIQRRADRILRWAEERIRGPIVYGFWRGKRCLYVGKGLKWKRLRSYDKSIYLLQADTLEVFEVAGRAALPKVECLCVHLYDPRDNRAKPGRAKWGKSCPICVAHDAIRSELRRLFAF